MVVFYDDIIENVPDYKVFLTVDEMDESTMRLQEEYPDVVEVFEAGRSRKGHPIYCLKIGDGSQNAFAFGTPHPNEPIGSMMLEYLSRALAENKEFREKLGYTWYIIKSSDPDGTKLNEKWFKGPFTLYNYARNFFRPASYQQVEWTFPIKYKKLNFNDPLPETKVLMNIIDKVKPDFMYSLHNAGFGGAYWYITDDIKEIYDDLRNAARKQSIPLNLGEAEAPYCEAFSPAIYKMEGSKESYDYYEKYSDVDIDEMFTCGTDSSDYARQRGNTVSFLTELPYFYDPRIEDDSESDIVRKDAILKSCECDEKIDEIIENILVPVEEYVSKDNPFYLVLNERIAVGDADIVARKKWAESGEEFLRRAKVSEAFDNIYISAFYNMLSLGMLVRLFEYELENYSLKDEEKITAFQERKDKSLEMLKKLDNILEEEMNYSVIPIQKLVRVQLECGLIVATYLKENPHCDF